MDDKLYTYKAKCIRVVDGDTIDAEVDLGFKTFVRERFRLLGIDTPETYGVKKDSEEYKAGKLATDFVTEQILNKEIIIQTVKDKTGKYGRYLVTIFLEDGSNLNETLIKEGYAKEYI